MTEPIIICPNCKTEIKLTESLAAPGRRGRDEAAILTDGNRRTPRLEPIPVRSTGHASWRMIRALKK